MYPNIFKYMTNKICVECDKKYDGHYNSKYCIDCKKINKLRISKRYRDKQTKIKTPRIFQFNKQLLNLYKIAVKTYHIFHINHQRPLRTKMNKNKKYLLLQQTLIKQAV